MPFDFTYLSLGAGVQSSALLVMSNLGLHGCPRADVAIFADTQSEPPWVYEQVEWLKKWSKIPVETVTAGNLGENVLKVNRPGSEYTSSDYAGIPAHVESRGEHSSSILIRKCTRNYKIYPIRSRVRQLLGYEPRRRVKKRRWPSSEFPGMKFKE